MNNRQKLVQAHFLGNEDIILKRLLLIYRKSQSDINSKIQHLTFKIGRLEAEYFSLDDTDPQKAAIKSQIQAKIYQKQYQEQLKKQIDGILNEMQVKQFTTISEYLDACYTDGFIGTVFDLHGQNIPLIMPINQESMVTAVQLDSKISEGLYTHLNEDVQRLKTVIASQVTRGIASGMTYAQIAQQISMRMLGTYENAGGSYAYARRIARTEGHRIQVQAAMDACYNAKERGADIVKQWDSTLDYRTRKSHRHVDGEIRELDQYFSNGLRFPSDPWGRAAEVINCRCALLQRARSALDAAELEELKERAAFFGLDKSDSFNDFKQKYLKAAEAESQRATMKFTETISPGVLTNSGSSGKMNAGLRIGMQFFASKEKQFGKKIGKHAADFGLDPSKAEDREKMRLIIDGIIKNAEEIRIGQWRGQLDEVLFFIKGEDVVLTDQTREFITILKGGITNARVKKARIK